MNVLGMILSPQKSLQWIRILVAATYDISKNKLDIVLRDIVKKNTSSSSILVKKVFMNKSISKTVYKSPGGRGGHFLARQKKFTQKYVILIIFTFKALRKFYFIVV